MPSEIESPVVLGRSLRASARVHRAVVAAAIGQLTALVALSAAQWHRGALSFDFGLYGQAFWLIGHGHFNPWSSLLSLPFSHNNAEFVLWPLGLLGMPFGGTPFVLLVLQDLALSAAGFVALCWIIELLDERADLDARTRRRLVTFAVYAVALDPWCFQTAMFDFHTESFAALFLLLAARELHLGRTRRLVVALLLLASTGTVGVLGAFGLGLSAIVRGRGSRLLGTAIALSSFCWLQLLSALNLTSLVGSAKTSDIGFGYLEQGTHHAGAAGLLVGVATHLPAVAHLVMSRLPTALLFLLPVGVVGVFSRRALFPAASIALPAMLAHSSIFFRVLAAFQVWPVVLLVLVSSVELVASWASVRSQRVVVGSHRIPAAVRRGVTAGWATAWVTGLASLSAGVLLAIPTTWISVTEAAGETISAVARSASASTEVICSQGIVGRFASRSQVYAVMSVNERFPVTSRHVLFVLAPWQGVLQIRPSLSDEFITSVERLPGARVLEATPSVTAVTWTPPAGVTSVTMPRASSMVGAGHVG